MLTYTARLVRVDELFRPTKGSASGFIVTRGTKHFLVSAAHSFWRGDRWAMEVDLRDSDRKVLIPIQAVQFIARFTVDDLKNDSQVVLPQLLSSVVTIDLSTLDSGNADIVVEPLDVAWMELDIDALRGALHGETALLSTYSGPINATPTSTEIYGFAAAKSIEFHAGSERLVRVDAPPGS
jgi:hypothetical protein